MKEPNYEDNYIDFFEMYQTTEKEKKKVEGKSMRREPFPFPEKKDVISAHVIALALRPPCEGVILRLMFLLPMFLHSFSKGLNRGRKYSQETDLTADLFTF